MKAAILSLLLTSLCIWFVSAQKGQRNRYDTTYARPHELSVAIGISTGPGAYPSGIYHDGNGPTFSVQYARVYKFNHFLRTGLSVGVTDYNQGPHYYFPSTPSPGDGQPDNYTSQKLAVHNSVANTFAGAFVGYEYGVGVRRFRFTFGADLSFGFHKRKIDTQEDAFLETRTYDPISDLYQYNLQFQHTGNITGSSDNIYMSLTPRIGIRRELGRRIALALTFTPRIGFTQRLRYTEEINDVKPTNYFNPQSAWFVNQGAELRLIVKLGKY